MAAIEFVRNQQDLSSDKGYQFKFFCDKCGNGFLSEYRTSSLGVASGLLSAAGSIFGGLFGSVSSGAYGIEAAVGGKAHDDALREAVEEMKPKFRRCTRCGHWVCPDVCWNEERQLCEDCAPDLREEAAAAQAQVAKEQLWDKARQVDLAKGVDLGAHAVSVCPQCGAHAGSAKFCPECGAPLSVKATCTKCGVELAPKAKFCPECGTPHAA